ncbi:hypothetical protein ASPZODRAFT_677037 [Penicilliopsis zonata CBS 506.65]|uniref:Uncharacterized protein n=1 Tax=Penicilliopsis zonata CBS 506.65 TaxID=1073090 RepID=A0A1L9SDC7_9EURO|nr:hypothetical protein ASPZODRAFT_677037 [Penicilliopsis zonata CBS 506.65]OJJ45094.1 hypothetical protein ASPZODRAFT_677037 [Penicilliopsis zonata CBS 506.65]
MREVVGSIPTKSIFLSLSRPCPGPVLSCLFPVSSPSSHPCFFLSFSLFFHSLLLFFLSHTLLYKCLSSS